MFEILIIPFIFEQPSKYSNPNSVFDSHHLKTECNLQNVLNIFWVIRKSLVWQCQPIDWYSIQREGRTADTVFTKVITLVRGQIMLWSDRRVHSFFTSRATRDLGN